MASRADLIMKQFNRDAEEVEYDIKEKDENDPFNKLMYDIANTAEGAILGKQAGEMVEEGVDFIKNTKNRRQDRSMRRASRKLNKGNEAKAMKHMSKAISRGADPSHLIEVMNSSVTNYQITQDGNTIQVTPSRPVTPEIQSAVNGTIKDNINIQLNPAPVVIDKTDQDFVGPTVDEKDPVVAEKNKTYTF